jgi:competence protein ComEC
MGDDREPDDPSLRAGVWCDDGGCSAPLGDGRRLFLNRTLAAVEEDCGLVPILVTQRRAPERCHQGSLVIDAAVLRSAAAIQVFAEGDGFRTVAARPLGMDRPWGRNLRPRDPGAD